MSAGGYLRKDGGTEFQRKGKRGITNVCHTKNFFWEGRGGGTRAIKKSEVVCLYSWKGISAEVLRKEVNIITIRKRSFMTGGEKQSVLRIFNFSR